MQIIQQETVLVNPAGTKITGSRSSRLRTVRTPRFPCSRRALAPVIFDLKQQPGHGREVRRLIDALKRCRKIKIKLRVVRFRELLIVRGQNVNAGGMDGDTLVVDKGQIVQRGTHEALMAQGGIYRRFITGREQAMGWKL